MDFCAACYSEPVFLAELNGHCGECLGRVLPGSGVLSGWGVRVRAPQKGVFQRAGGCEKTAGRLETGLREARENNGRESLGSRERLAPAVSLVRV